MENWIRMFHWEAWRRPPFEPFLVLVLLMVHFSMAASVSRHFSTTSDEIVHVTAGYGYWTRSDFRLHPENGNFPQRWAALGLLPREELRFPTSPSEGWESADVWAVSRDFFFRRGNDPAAMLAASRRMIAALSTVLCLLIYFWSRSLFGRAGGALSLTLAAFSPTLLANGSLATSDTAAALGFALALLTWWRLAHRITLSRILLAGFAAGLLALSKFSAALFLPMIVVAYGIRMLRGDPYVIALPGGAVRSLRAKAGVPALAAASAAAALLAVALIWAAYDFRYAASAEPNARFFESWDQVLLKTPPPESLAMADGTRGTSPEAFKPGIVQATVSWMRDRRILPEAFLYGLAFVDEHARARLAFFAGEYRTTGWREFFPASFLLKTTIPEMVLMIVGAVGLVRRLQDRRPTADVVYRLTPLLALIAIYGAFSIQSPLNIGHRHLLPIYPALFILAGGAAAFFIGRRWLLIVPVLLLGWHVRESFWINPHFLAYFNPIAGGPEKAHRLFVDSSLDWGQDLPGLKQWLDANARDEPVFLSYFGSGDPKGEGIQATRVGDGYFDWSARPTPAPLSGGVYCISATMLRRVYTHVRGPWSDAYEREYRRLDAWLRRGPTGEDGRWQDESGALLTTEAFNARLFTYEQLQFGRLCQLLDQRPPDAHVGYSILIYHLSTEEVRSALATP